MTRIKRGSVKIAGILPKDFMSSSWTLEYVWSNTQNLRCTAFADQILGSVDFEWICDSKRTEFQVKRHADIYHVEISKVLLKLFSENILSELFKT